MEDSSESIKSPTTRTKPSPLVASDNGGLRYRKRSLWLLGIYATLLMSSWIFTCVLMHRPISLPSYINQSGEYSLADWGHHERWMVAVDLMEKVVATIAVPTVSALLAQAAVVYTQRRKREQKLNMLQTFALADRGWTDITTLWQTLGGSSAGSSNLLWAGACLVLIGQYLQLSKEYSPAVM